MPDERFIHPAEGESERLTELTDFEFRVWIAYKVSANDVGVMLDSHVPIQTGNRNLRNRPSKDIRKALDAMLRVSLMIRFKHQGEHYVCSPVWQDWQRVKHPRQTHLPLPDSSIRAACSEATVALFEKIEKHREDKSEKLRNISEDFGNVTATERESLEPHARDHARNANANALSSSEALKREEPEKGPVLDLAPGQLRLAAHDLVAEWNVRVGPLGTLAYIHNPEPSIGRVIASVRLRPDMTEWRAIIDRSLQSDFLMGRVPGPDGKTFKLDFWWLLKDDHADCVLAGRYDNRDNAAVATSERRRDAEKRDSARVLAIGRGEA